MEASLEEGQVRRAYDLYSPVYDFLFKKVFEPGRLAGIRMIGPELNGRVLEVGIGTGLNLPLYPRDINLVGIDLSEGMLRKAQEKVQELRMGSVTLKVMDASALDFGDGEFDATLATYVISAVPDPVAVFREMRRVTKPGGTIVILNHFRSQNPVMRHIEDALAPVCAHLGWKTNLALPPLLKTVGLTPEVVRRVNMLRGWHLVKCINRARSPDRPPTLPDKDTSSNAPRGSAARRRRRTMILRRPVSRLVATWALTGLLVLLVIPVGIRASAVITGLCFLVEFLTEGRHPWLSRVTEAPVVEPLAGSDGQGVPPDLWHPGGGRRGPWPGLVLVHGLTPDGKRDGRLAWTADRLARAGFAVAVPDLPALRAQRLRPDDALIVRDAIARLAAHPAVQRAPVAILAVSVGLASVALALHEPGQAERVRLVLALGGYADARELIRYFTTGAYGFGATGGRARVDPSLALAFLARNLDLVPDWRDRTAVADALQGRPLRPDAGPGARAVLALLQNREPARVDTLLDTLPAETQGLLDALSPVRYLGPASPRLLVIHGKNDPAIPFTESARLAAAVGDRARVVVVELIGHVEGEGPTWRRLADVLRLWSVSYELLAG